MKKLSLNAMVALGALAVSGCAVEAGEQFEESDSEATTESALRAPAEAAPQHCVVSLDSGESTCYSSFSDAIAAATEGRIADAPADARAAVVDDTFTARLDAVGATVGASYATYVVGIFFQHSNYQGATYTITAGGTCTSTLSDTDFSLASMASGWNDVVSSFKCYANCYCKIYEHTNFGGATYGYYSSSSYVGAAMNDRCSSITFS